MRTRRIVRFGLVGGIGQGFCSCVKAAMPAEIQERPVIGLEAKTHIEMKAAIRTVPNPVRTGIRDNLTPELRSLKVTTLDQIDCAMPFRTGIFKNS